MYYCPVAMNLVESLGVKLASCAGWQWHVTNVGNSQKSSEICHIMLMLNVITVRPSACRDTGSHSDGEFTASVERDGKVNYCVYCWNVPDPFEFILYCNTLFLFVTF